MESKIKIFDSESQLLYEFSMDQVEAAYAKAQELEEMGRPTRFIILVVNPSFY